VPTGALQPSFAVSRAKIYSVMAQVVPASSVRFAAVIGMNTASLWILLHVATTMGILQKEFLDFSDQSSPRPAGFNFWSLSINDLSTIGNLLRIMLAFLLLTMVRQRMTWLDTLKTKVWQAKCKAELLSFILGGVLSGDGAPLQRARFDMHRWLTASVFFSFRDASPYLQCYSVSHLMQSGILTEHEGRCLERIIEVNAPQSITAGPCEGFLQHDCADVADGKLSPTNSAPQTRSCNSNAKARDCLLWWINMRVRAAVNEGLLDKKTMKKALAGIWNVRDSFELLTVEASRRPMQLWSVLMQIMVDAYVVLVPISTLQEVYHNHVWLLPWAVLRSFVVAFFLRRSIAYSCLAMGAFWHACGPLGLGRGCCDNRAIHLCELWALGKLGLVRVASANLARLSGDGREQGQKQQNWESKQSRKGWR